jgi:hypothetical protein
MKDAMRIRIAAAVTTVFIGGLAGTGIAMRHAQDAAPPPGAQPSAIASKAPAPARLNTAARGILSPRTAISRVSPSIGTPRAGAKPVGRRDEREPRSEAFLD